MLVKIAVLTSGRSDFGLIRPVVKHLSLDPAFETTVACLGPAVTFSDAYLTEGGVGAVQIARFPLDAKDGLSRSTDAAVCLSSICQRFAAWLDEAGGTDWVVAPGDRFEVFGAVIAAYYAACPIAHLFAGDRSQGGHLDDSVRHAITKLAHLHLAVCKDSRDRVLALGEEPWRVHDVGSPVVESVREALDGLDTREPPGGTDARKGFTILATYHPISTEPLDAGRQFDALVAAFDRIGPSMDVSFILTYPNLEYGSQQIIDRLVILAGRSRYRVFEQLGWKRYLQTMSQCDLVVGNSSSLLLEAPILGVPALTIGTRQKGRFSPASVRHVEAYDPDAIATAIGGMLLAPRLPIDHPYGPGDASARIVGLLRQTSAERSRAAVIQKQITF